MIRLALSSAMLVLATGLAGAQDFTTLKGHGGPIMDIAVSATGVVTASFDNSIGVWRERRPRWLEGHAAAVTSVAQGRDRVLVSGSDDFTVRLWSNGENRVLGRHRGKVSDVAISPDNRTVASASWDGSIGLWPLDGGAAHMLRKPGAGINAVAYTADGTALFVASANGRVFAVSLDSPDYFRPLVQHGFGVNELIVGKGWLAYGAVDGVTRVVDTGDGHTIAEFFLDRRPILAMAYDRPAGLLAVGDGQGYIMMIDVSTWRIIKDFRAMRDSPVWALAFSPDGRMIYAGGLDSVVYGWPLAMLDAFEPGAGKERDFLKDTGKMPNGERQFMRKCSICHALTSGPSRKAGPTLYGLFGRRAGTMSGYRYSRALGGSDIIWSDKTIDALFALGPDRYTPGSKMPLQRITRQRDRRDLIEFLKAATARQD